MIDVHFLLLPGSLIMDWAGPAEALRIANQCLRARGQAELFRLHYVGPQAQTVSSVGAQISGLQPLPDTAGLHTDGGQHWIVVVGQPGDRVDIDTPAMHDALHWLRGLRLSPGRVELLCVCAGTIIAAHAGLLGGRHVTTHHQHLDELRQSDPLCRVLDNRVFVTDGPVCTSAGVTTGIDLFLHRISALAGPALAAQVAQGMVVALRRGPGDPELSPFLNHRNHLHPALHRLQDAIGEQPQADWSVARMAEVACTSPRHLTRLFLTHAGIAPLRYLQGIRLGLAQAALRAGMSVTKAAETAGFSSDTQLRRTWRQHGLQGSPASAQA